MLMTQKGLVPMDRSMAGLRNSAMAPRSTAFMPQVILGGKRPTRYAPTFKPTRHYQLGRQEAPMLGQTFKAEALPRAISFGVLGGAAIVLGTTIPGAAGTVATATGIGLIGYGLYSTFSGPAAPEKTEVEVSRLPLPEGQTRENTRVTASFTYPPKDGTINQSLLGHYRLAFSVTNRGETPVDVIATVHVEEFTRVTREKGVREKTYELRGIKPGAQKGIVDPEFPSSFITGRHDAVGTLYLQLANDHGGDVFASTIFALDPGV